MSSTQDSAHPSSQAGMEPTLPRRTFLTAATMAAPAALLIGAESGKANAADPRRSNGKAALVTGSSRGIGAAIAKRLALDGYSVTVNYLGNRNLASAVVRDIEVAGGRAIFDQADVSDPAAVCRLFDKHQQAFGRIDVVVANAGIQRLGSFSEMSDEDYAAWLTSI